MVAEEWLVAMLHLFLPVVGALPVGWKPAAKEKQEITVIISHIKLLYNL